MPCLVEFVGSLRPFCRRSLSCCDSACEPFTYASGYDHERLFGTVLSAACVPTCVRQGSLVSLGALLCTHAVLSADVLSSVCVPGCAWRDVQWTMAARVVPCCAEPRLYHVRVGTCCRCNPGPCVFWHSEPLVARVPIIARATAG